jgi:hypothetical protein
MIGGILTVLSRFGMVIFFLMLISQVIDKKKTVTFKSVYKSAINDKQVYHLDLNNFDFAFGLNFVGAGNFSSMKKNVHKYIKIDFMHYDLRFQETGINMEKTITRKFSPINYTSCNLDRFLNKTDDMNKMGMD